jgi:hypothetical protein
MLVMIVPFSQHRAIESVSNLLRRCTVASMNRNHLNFFVATRAIDKFVSSLSIRLDETLPKLVELTKSRQLTQSRNTKLPRRDNSPRLQLTARSAVGVPERAADGQLDALHGGAIYMAAKKTAKKSTKKKAAKKTAKKKR